jgi:RNA methyltransferase, TrmH family
MKGGRIINMLIISSDNSKIKYLHRLQVKSAIRRREKKFVMEGAVAIKSALENLHVPDEIYLCPEIFKESERIIVELKKREIPVIEVSEKCFEKISDVKTPQGIAALFSFCNHEPESIFQNPEAKILCCFGMQDPGNLGTIIRTADAAGATAVMTLPPSVSFYNPKTVRSSASSILNIPVKAMGMEEFISLIKNSGIKTFSAMPHGGVDFREAELNAPVCIVIGSEAHGIPEEIIKISKAINIPMRKGVESLNAAISAALLLYQLK